MNREIIITEDGSHTISIPEIDVTYHSIHGAIQESMHVFLNAGFREAASRFDRIRIFEMGLGTGLNALLTLEEAEKLKYNIHYTAVELYPCVQEQVEKLNYCDSTERKHLRSSFEKIHTSPWETDTRITEYFTLFKSNADLLDFNFANPLDLIYFDAFAPEVQPELWTAPVFSKLYGAMSPGGVLVTYCSKGDVRRALMAAGFHVEKIQGPPGKREMVRATKPQIRTGEYKIRK
jgi:tRNA U34 5-methylaminomethyl-2-thiouridine-forming methyltransferase MnmC